MKSSAPEKSSVKILQLSLFYTDPDIEIDLLELEAMCTERYRILKSLEVHQQKRTTQEDKEFGLSLRTQQNKKVKLWPDDEKSILNDQISHFILKLSVCQSIEESKFWMDMETLLFKYRLKALNNAEFLLSPYISFPKVSKIPFLHEADSAMHPLSTSFYYKVPLSLSASLVQKKYFPIRGYCYIDPADLSIIACEIFRSGLQLALATAQQTIVSDERILRIFSMMKDPDFDYGYKVPVLNRDINLNNLEGIAKIHFPPCMKKLMNNLKSNHHLKHMGRLQLGLFLKGLGLPLEESLAFWRKMFAEKVPSDKFAKNYEYNIKHSYGKLGKMADYSPWSCNKITRMTMPPVGEYHGCPFRHSTQGELISLLASYPNLDQETKDWILKRHDKEPQMSCIKLFENTHIGVSSNSTEKVGIYPNAFFDASFEFK